jgi:hypothetical protein
MRRQNTVFVTDVNVPTHCTASRNTSCRGTGLKIMFNRQSTIVPDRPRGNVQANQIQNERHALKTLDPTICIAVMAHHIPNF